MLTFVVMPCLDEVSLVGEAIGSLGFMEEGATPPGAHLVVVDNGSTDGTLPLLERISATSAAPIHLVSESARGFVPPRRRGVLEAQQVAGSLGNADQDVLILQADADTIYRSGYIATMQHEAVRISGVMLEGATKPPADFGLTHARYLAAQRLVDDHTDPLNAPDEHEVVLDDKVCGFRLSDYLAWGGLFEEWTTAGDAIHAETTRLFMRARLRYGTSKRRVNPAGAVPSRRKILENPWLQYATAGFPREASWVRRWEKVAARVRDVDSFSLAVLEGREAEATFLRRAHQLALFRYLPALVARSEGEAVSSETPRDVLAALDAVPARSDNEMARCPGRTVLDALQLIETRPDLFDWR